MLDALNGSHCCWWCILCARFAAHGALLCCCWMAAGRPCHLQESGTSGNAQSAAVHVWCAEQGRAGQEPNLVERHRFSYNEIRKSAVHDDALGRVAAGYLWTGYDGNCCTIAKLCILWLYDWSTHATMHRSFWDGARCWRTRAQHTARVGGKPHVASARMKAHLVALVSSL